MMNERIKELAEQADLYARSDNSSMAFDSWKNRYTEKFAELIVKECIRVSDETGTSSLISDRIAERFGFRS